MTRARRPRGQGWSAWIRANLDKKTIAGITLLAASWFQSNHAIKREGEKVDQDSQTRSLRLRARVENVEDQLDSLGLRLESVERRKTQVIYKTVEPIGPPAPQTQEGIVVRSWRWLTGPFRG